MDYSTKITMSKNEKIKNMILVCVIASISVLGLVMIVYSLSKSMYMFAVIYMIAVVLGFSYVVMRINTIMPTYIALSDKYIYVQNWENGYFSFRIDKGFFGEFLPEKTVLRKIDISLIQKLYIGSKSYMERLLPELDFYKNTGCENNKYDSALKRMEFMYVFTKDKKELCVSVSEYAPEELGNVVNIVLQKNENIEFSSDNRIITKIIPSKKATIWYIGDEE